MSGENFASRFQQSFWLPFKSLVQEEPVCAQCDCPIYPNTGVIVLCIIFQLLAPFLCGFSYILLFNYVWERNILPCALVSLTINFLFYFALPALLTTAISWQTGPCSSVNKKIRELCTRRVGKYGLGYLAIFLVPLGATIAELL